MVKWKAFFSTLQINSTPKTYGLSGEGDLLLTTEDGQLLRFSPYGELLERCSIEELGIDGNTVTLIDSVPGGVIVGTSTGSIGFLDIREKTELLWKVHLSSSIVGITFGEGTVFAVATDGSIKAVNVTDGSPLWTTQIKTPFYRSVDTVWDYEQFHVTGAGFSGAWSIDGRQLRNQTLPLDITNPILSSSGLGYAALPQWLLGCWKLETRIKTEKKSKKSQTYGILTTIEPSWYQYIPESFGYAFSLFDEITDALKTGNIGTNERFYARELSRILANTERPSIERARAASLLGQLGSSEYRSVLLDMCYGSFDPTLAEGLLWGLASCASDPDGLSLVAVRHLIRTAGPREKGVLLTASDCLYALIRYAENERALEGTRMLTSFLESPYDNVLGNRARQLLARLLN